MVILPRRQGLGGQKWGCRSSPTVCGAGRGVGCDGGRWAKFDVYVNAPKESWCGFHWLPSCPQLCRTLWKMMSDHSAYHLGDLQQGPQPLCLVPFL